MTVGFYFFIIGTSIFTFDGTASTIVDLRTTLQCVQGNNPRSISFMIQTTTLTCKYVLSTGQYGVQLGSFIIAISCGSTANIIQIFFYGASYYPTSGQAINDGLWHTVLVTYDGTALSIYVDGRLDNSATNWNNAGSTTSIASTLNTVGNSGNYLGSSSDGSFGRWSGKLKNVGFYDYVIAYSDGK